MKIQLKIKHILALIKKAYGRPPAFSLSDPVDELVRTILSQNTNDKNSLAAFAILKKNFRSWDELTRTNTRKIVHLIKHAGLANIKAKRIKEVLEEIRSREGSLNLANLTRLDTGDAVKYLTSLKGVGPKTAACVLLFSFGKPIMPVDTHIFRVAKRLGLIDEDLNIEEAHDVLSAIVPKHLIYEFHLGIIEHGRKICKASAIKRGGSAFGGQGPKCGPCVLYRLCRFEKKAFYRKK